MLKLVSTEAYNLNRKYGFRCHVYGVFVAIVALVAPGVRASEEGRQTPQAQVSTIIKHLKPIARMDPQESIELVIGLPVRNVEGLTDRLNQIYDPDSEEFAQYLTPRRFVQQFGPTEAEYQKLISFARRNKLSILATSPTRTLLHVKGHVRDIERIFKVNMMLYHHPTEDRTFYSTDVEPSVDIGVHVLHVTGFDNYQLPRSPLKDVREIDKNASPIANAGSAPGGQYTGKDFRPAYAPGVTLEGSGQSVGLLQFDGYYVNDIKAYETDAGLPSVPIQNVFLDGFTGTPSTSGNGNLETSLDIEMVVAMAPKISKLIIYGAPPTTQSTVDALNEMANPTKGEPLPYQLSTSWSIIYDDNVYQIFQQMAAQGQSFFSASGDNGAYTAYTQTANDTLPFPPSDSIYVTSVGGTVLQTSGPAGQWVAETAWADGGGGPSPWFSIPSWQSNIVNSSNHASGTWRNCPDVAMIAANIRIIARNGVAMAVGGTSASSPLWAGYAALANEQARNYGRPPLGFLNPRLYAIGNRPSYALSLHDITTGTNAHTGTAGLYSSVGGYDLTTGWGTPNGTGTITALVQPTLCQQYPQFCYSIYDPLWWLKCPACGLDIFINRGDDFRNVAVLDSLGREVGRFQRLEKPITANTITYNYKIRLTPKKGIGYFFMATPSSVGESEPSFKPQYLVRTVKSLKPTR